MSVLDRPWWSRWRRQGAQEGPTELPVRVKGTEFSRTTAAPAQVTGIDQTLVWVVVALVLWGLVMVYSASIAMPDNPRFANYSPYHFLSRHAFSIMIALVAAVLVFQIPIDTWERVAPWVFVVSLVLLILVLIPFIVPTVLSAIAFWWIFDSQFSIISWSLKNMGLINENINFLGDPNNARASLIFANIWRGVPFIAITLLAGLQTVSPSLYEAATLDGATRWQNFWYITFPLLTPIIAVVMTFSVLFTFTDFQLIWAMTRGGPVNATHLMATLGYQRAIMAGNLGEGSAIATAMVPFLLVAIMVSWFGLQRRKWQQGGRDD